ncbi:hypothetical protein Pcinc_023292 [Petrolisthes cinctipes]|uniref:Uncharacterized protein n=1 Tax=Petrolisthes cinctipes TaxID=88211 RepID=A0AAE1F918_PETCI|nr:hypothetical protein Pcinc_025154 [Petrolisthes cinctipes]KAK3871571.1 hypothetical protein Pcinc_023292 [Petrolisthes cinctipes]
MPPHKTVHTLQAFAKDKVLLNLCSVILDEIFFSQDEKWDIYGPPVLSVRLELVRDILTESLSPTLLGDILSTILSRDEAVEATVRYLAIQLLLVEGVRTLAVGRFPETYYSLVLEATAKCGFGLHHLDLRGLWVKEEHKPALMRVLRKLVDIRRLTLRYNCNDDMLAALGKYSNHLQKLDISGSSEITEAGLVKLCHNPSRVAMDTLPHSLLVVDIGGPGSQELHPSQACYLLLNLPHLVSLGSYEKAGAAVEMVYNSHPDRQLGLLYLHDKITSSTKYLAIHRTCRMLQVVYFDSPKDLVVHSLELLKYLKEVKLHKVRWSDVVIMLTKMGDRLRHLFLLSVFGEIEVSELGHLCTHLQRLEIHNSTLTYTKPPEPTAFQELEELHIYTNRVSSGCLMQLLTQCKSAVHIALRECGLTDAELTMVLIEGGLNKVRDLWMGAAQTLTMQGVETLLGHCSDLTSLGNLAGWSVHPVEVDLLRFQLLLTNTDLDIHAIGPEEDEWIPLQEDV